MAKPGTLDGEHDKDRRQVRQHFVHWGVKTVATMIVALLAGVLWLAWVAMTGSR